MAHSLFIGMTESGKTTLAKQKAWEYKRAGIRVLVCDPLRSKWEMADLQTESPQEFLEIAQHPDSRNLALFVDESGQTIGRHAKELQWLATQSRHRGHNCHFIAQRCAQVDTTIRDQCTFFYIFKVSFKDSKTLAEEFSSEILKTACSLDKLEFFKSGRYCETKKYKINFGD